MKLNRKKVFLYLFRDVKPGRFVFILGNIVERAGSEDIKVEHYNENFKVRL